jgi:methionine-rich copper-binding protein CopC
MSIRTPRVGAVAGLAVALLAALLILPTIALGHAELDTASPADKSTVVGSPAEIVMTFVQNLDPAKSSIRVVNAAGTVVADGGTVPSGKPREMDLVLTTPLAPGKYTIRWTTSSTEDGELAHGTTTFTVTAPPPSATPAPSIATPAPSASAPASVAPSVAPIVTPAPSSPPTTPAASTNDALIPIVAALVVLVGLGTWLLRSRARGR